MKRCLTRTSSVLSGPLRSLALPSNSLVFSTFSDVITSKLEILEKVLDAKNKEKRLEKLRAELEDGTLFGTDPRRATRYQKEIGSLTPTIGAFLTIKSSLAEIKELRDLAIAENDDDFVAELEVSESDLVRELDDVLLDSKLNEDYPMDTWSCVMQFQPGQGGDDAKDFLWNFLFPMYEKYCRVSDRFSCKRIDSDKLFIRGPNAFGWFKREGGTHKRVSMRPSTSGSEDRHTSYAEVVVLPVTDEDWDGGSGPNSDLLKRVDEYMKSIKIDVFRAQGKGGQSVNKTNSAVRCTQVELNIVAQCQDERSQIQNLANCKMVLRGRILERLIEDRDAERARIRAELLEKKEPFVRTYKIHGRPAAYLQNEATGYQRSGPEAIERGLVRGDPAILDGFFVDSIVGRRRK